MCYLVFLFFVFIVAKKEKLVRPKKLKKKPPPLKKQFRCKVKKKQKICGENNCQKSKIDLEYGPRRIEPKKLQPTGTFIYKPQKKTFTIFLLLGKCNDTEGDL